MARILLVEDDEVLRQMTKTILQVDGHEVFVAENGMTALEIFPAIKPDLVVSDISMPIMDGFTLLKQIRGLLDGSFVPFLFLTALSERSDLLRARELGVDDYITKPFTANDLLFAVRERINAGKWPPCSIPVRLTCRPSSCWPTLLKPAMCTPTGMSNGCRNMPWRWGTRLDFHQRR